MKKLKIDFKQCCGCRRCEVVCSLMHGDNSVNPKKSRIRVMEAGTVFYPVVAGPFNNAECTSKNIFVFEGREVDECVICRASCPVKPWFKDPETEELLQCDFCGDPPNPACVKWCPCQAITLVDESGHIEITIEDVKKDYQPKKIKKREVPRSGSVEEQIF